MSKMPPKMPFAQDSDNGLKTCRSLLQGTGRPLPFAPKTGLQSGALRLSAGAAVCFAGRDHCPGDRPARRHILLAHSHGRRFALSAGIPLPRKPSCKAAHFVCPHERFPSGIPHFYPENAGTEAFFHAWLFRFVRKNPSICFVKEAFESLFCSFVQKSANMFVCNFLDRK